jgi:hypothetical protein
MEADTSGANPPPPDPDLSTKSSISPEPPPYSFWWLIGAGAVGAGLALLAFSVLAPSLIRDQSASGLDSRLGQVEQQLRQMAGRPPAAGVDPSTVSDLASRLARLESAVATTSRVPAPDPALANRIATLEGELKALSERIGVVARRTDEIATLAADARSRGDAAAAAVAALPKAAPSAAGEVGALANRVGAFEQTVKGLEAELVKRAAEGSDRSLRLAVTAVLLQAAVERGGPFARELAAAKALGADAKLLAPLEPFAATGVPSTTALVRELSALVPTLRQASGAVARDGNFLDRLQANAEKLVRVRPIEDTPGDDVSAVLARIEQRAAQADITGALAELAKLPPALRSPAQAWIAKAEARNTAIEASRRFAADTLATLEPAP